MNPFASFGLPPIDPSKMDPKMLMELSQLMQTLPPELLNRMQMMMHNAQAGFDVRKEVESFERDLPPGFREKVMTVFARGAGAPGMAPAAEAPPIEVTSAEEKPVTDMNVREARLTILRAVAEGTVAPEEAERLLFGS